MAIKNDKENLLEVVQEKAAESQKEEVKKPVFELPDGYLLAQEMKELFEEDIVTHVQGPSEPEAD
ncbi:MAG: hypothetical protein HY037_03955 [Nitrospirae bacterium]|nr:hypothetical protein [Candidatus Troglogloeales bacterium]